MSKEIMIGNEILRDKEFREKMKAAGILLEDGTGIKIDIPAGDACKVYAYPQEGDPLVGGCRITGHEIFQSEEVRQKMIDVGILPDDCTKIVIDIPARGPCKVYTELWLRKEAMEVVCDIAVKIAADEKEKGQKNEN